MIMAAGLAILLVGLLGLAVAVRGQRVDDHPVCRRCRFDLVGIYGNSERCPECGTGLSTRRTIRTGNRRVRRRMAGGSIAMVLISAVLLGLLGWGHATGINWNTYKSAWLLASEARSARPDVASAAMAEFTLRLEKGRLPHSRAADLIELWLVQQRDDLLTWAQEWGDFLEAARSRDLLSPEQIAQYAQNAINVSLRSRTRAMQGDPWPMQIEYSNRRVSSSKMLLVTLSSGTAIITGAGLDQPLILPEEMTRRGAFALAGTGSSASTRFELAGPELENLPPGEYTVSIRHHFDVKFSGGQVEPLHQWETDLVQHITIAPGDEAVVEVVTDETLRATLENAVHVGVARLRSAPERGAEAYSLYGDLRINGRPLDVAFAI